MSFGSAFTPFPVPPPTPAPLDVDQLAQAIATAVSAAVASVVLPTPQVTVDGPDLTDMVNAVAGLGGNASAAEIAEAIAARLRFPEVPDSSAALAAIAAAMEKLDFRMKGAAFGGGGGQLPGSVEVSNFPSPQVVGGSVNVLNAFATEATHLDIKRGITGDEQRLDYDGSNNLIYSGKAPNGTATSASTWVVSKLSYTGANLTRVQQLTGSWDGRASLGW